MTYKTPIDNQCPRAGKLVSYLIAIFAIMSLNPFFGTVQNVYMIIFLAFLFIVAVYKRIMLLDRKIVTILSVVYFLIVVQWFIFKGISIAAIYLPLCLFYIPYLIYRLLGISFFRYFNNVLYVIGLYTLPLWFLQSFSPSFDQLMREAIKWAYPISWSSTPRALFFYTPAWGDIVFNEWLGIYRNSGLFHEPGAYGVFLIIGIVTNTLLTGKFFSKKNALFVFCLLTTLSTSAYIALFIIATVFLCKTKINLPLRVIVLFLSLVVSYYVYHEANFMKSKIQAQCEDQLYAVDRNTGEYIGQSGRFFAFYTSIKFLLKNPIFGRGILYATGEKAAGEMHENSSYSYGFIGFFATYGLIFGVYYLLNLYQGLRRIGLVSGQGNFVVFSGFLAINLELLTQCFFISTVIVLIFIIGVYSHDRKTGEIL